jgi:hypothetical protein
MLKLMKAATMTEHTPATVSDIEDAATARWLTRTLGPARAAVMRAPTAEAVDRIRARVLGEAAPRKHTRSLAA